MPDYIKRLLDYINRTISASENVVIEKIEIFYALRAFLMTPDEDFFDNSQLFYPLNEISDLLIESSLSIEDQILVCLYIIRKQMPLMFESKTMSIDKEKIGKFNFKYLTEEKFWDIVYGPNFGDYINGIPQNIGKKEVLEFRRALKKCSVNENAAKEVFANLVDHYFDKVPNLTQEDIDETISALTKAGIGSAITTEFKGFLEENLFATTEEKVRALNENRELSNRVLKKLEQHIIVASNKRTNKLKDPNGQQKNPNLEFFDAFQLSYLYGFIRYKHATKLSKIIFDNFSIIDASKLSGSLDNKDLIDLVFYIIESNITNGLLSPNVSMYDQKTELTAFFLETIRFIDNMSNSNTFPYLPALIKRNACMNTFEPQNAVHFLYEFDAENFTKYIDAHEAIKIHYLDKKDSFDMKDISYILFALELLALPKSTIVIIKSALVGDFNKRQRLAKETPEMQAAKAEANRVAELAKAQRSAEINEVALKKVRNEIKEKKALYFELSTYFNFETMKAFRFLTPNEIASCIHLATSLDYSTALIENFKRIQNKYNRNEIKPLLRYEHLKSYILEYKDSPKISKLLKQIDEAAEALSRLNSINNLFELSVSKEVNSTEMLKSINEIEKMLGATLSSNVQAATINVQKRLNEDEEFYQDSIAEDLDAILEEIEQIKLSTSFNHGVLEKK